MTGEELTRLLTGPFLAACALLAVGGRDQGDATRPVRAPRRRRSTSRVTRARSAFSARVELAVAVSGACFGGWAAAAVAATYVLLTAAAFSLWRSAPGTPCGCLGASPTPATGGHVALNAIAATIAAVVATGPTPISVLGDQPLLGIPFLVLTACATWLGGARDGRTARARRGGARREFVMAVLVAIEAVVLVLLTVLVAGLLRSHAEILRRLHTMGAGLDPDAADGVESPVALRPRGDLATRARRARACARPRRRRAPRRGRACSRRRRTPPHAARVPLERLPDLPHVLGSVRRRGRA